MLEQPTRVVRRRGFSTVYTVIIFTAVAGFCSLAVDYGRVQWAKTALQRNADASARAAAGALNMSIAEARSRAVAVSSQNPVDGQSLTIDAETDIEFGIWDDNEATFTVLSGADEVYANAVRVTARRTADSASGEIPMVFGPLIGKTSASVSASAIALLDYTAGYGIVGLEFIDMNGSVDIDAYDSNNGGFWDVRSADGHAATNGWIKTTGGVEIHGDLYHLPDGDVDLSKKTKIHAPGAIKNLRDPIVLEDPVKPLDLIEMGSLVKSNNGTTVLAEGRYLFDELKIKKNHRLHVTGPVEIYVEGPCELTGIIEVYDDKPRNFKVTMMTDDKITFGGNNRDVYIDLYAPYSPVDIVGRVDVFGRCIAKSITFTDNGDLAVDKDLTKGVWQPGSEERVILVD